MNKITKKSYGFIRVFDRNKKDEDIRALPDSLNLSYVDKDETIEDFRKDKNYIIQEADCFVKRIELKSRILTERNEGVFIWLNTHDSGRKSLEYRYIFVELFDYGLFPISHIKYHLVDTDGKTVDDRIYDTNPDYDTSDCFRLVCVCPNTSNEYFICIDSIVYCHDYSDAPELVLKQGIFGEVSKEMMENIESIKKARKDIQLRAKKEVAEFNSLHRDREDKISKFGIIKPEFDQIERRRLIDLYECTNSYQKYYEYFCPEDIHLSDVHKALDNLFSTYPRIVYDGDLIEFEIIVRVDEAFVALLALLENIPIKLIKICDKGYTKILFEISTKNTWLLLCLDCWISTQEIHGYYGFYTGCFYEHPILSCNQINKLENLNEDMSCINQNFSKTNSVFSLIMDDYYSPIINKAFKQYVKTEQIWSSELMLYILTKCFFPNAIHIYKANWLGKLSLDIYIPSLKIGIEYQGEQHFKEGPFGKTKEDLAVQQERDNRKKELCTKNDINLIEWTYKETFANALDFANAFNLKVRKPIIKIDAQREIYNHLSLKFKDLLKTYFYES